jgi:hypothetical protein
VWWSREQFAETWWKSPCDKRLFRLAGPAPATDEREAARETLAGLVRLAAEPYWTGWRKKAAPNAATGLAAIERYASDVADPAHAMQDQDGTNRDTCFFDRGWGCYAIYPQWTARECTARYLGHAAALFEDGAAKHVRDASAKYRAAYRAWQRWEAHLGRSTKFGSYDERWADPAHRRAGSEAAFEAMGNEKEAVASVKRAVSALERASG